MYSSLEDNVFLNLQAPPSNTDKDLNEITNQQEAVKLLQQAKQKNDQDDKETIDLYAKSAKLGNAEALQILETVANNENKRALHHLVIMYFCGYGVTRNANKAEDYISNLPTTDAWLARETAYIGIVRRIRYERLVLGSTKTLPDDEYRLKESSILTDVTSFYSLTIQAFNKRKEFSEPSANILCLLGKIHVDLYEIKKETEFLKQAKDFFKQAKKRGNAEAAFFIGNLYENEKDYLKAVKAYLKAYRMGYKKASTELKKICHSRLPSEEVTYFLGLVEENKEKWLSGLLVTKPKKALQRIENHYLREEITYEETYKLLQAFHEKRTNPPSQEWILDADSLQGMQEQNHYHLMLARLHLDQKNINEAEQNINLIRFHSKLIRLPESEINQLNFKLAEMYLANQYQEQAKQYIEKIAAVLTEELSKTTELTTSSEGDREKNIATSSEACIAQEIISSVETAKKVEHFAGLSEDQLLQLGLWCMNLYDPEMNDQARKAFEAALKINPDWEDAKINLEILNNSENSLETPSQKIQRFFTQMRKLLPLMKLQQSTQEKLNQSFSDLLYYFQMRKTEDIKTSYIQLIVDISQSDLEVKISYPLIEILNSLYKIISTEIVKEPSDNLAKENSHGDEKGKEKEKESNDILPSTPFDFDSAIGTICHQIEELTSIVMALAEKLPKLTDLAISSEHDLKKDFAVLDGTSASQVVFSSVENAENLVAKPQTNKKSGFLGLAINFFQSSFTKPSGDEHIDTNTTAKKKIANDNQAKTAGATKQL